VKVLKKQVSHLFVKTGLSCLFIMSLFSSGCGPTASTYEQIEQFNETDQVAFTTDANSAAATSQTSIYRVIPGDVLEFQMPTVLSAKSADLSDLVKDVKPFLSRVSDTGTVTLPVVGELRVAGMAVYEIENAVVSAYYPEYVRNRPTVVCKVSEHISKKQFTVMGLVNKPGVFEYPPEATYSVLDALAYAGGLHLVADPEYVTIYRRDAYGQVKAVTVKINRKSMAEISKIMVRPGDVIAAEMTARERANMVLANVFYVRAGMDLNLND
jgi:protein involved in polysaccharide export with SLBB domain